MELDSSTLITGLIVVITAIWAGADAATNRIPSDSRPYGAGNGALAWFLCCLLLWIVAFPWYLIRRAQVLGQRRREREREKAASVAAPPLPKPILCSHCGRYFEPGANFCPQCAAPNPAAAAQQQQR